MIRFQLEQSDTEIYSAHGGLKQRLRQIPLRRGCAIVPLLQNLKAPVTAEPSGHVALHADVFCLDNSKTRK